MAKAPQHQTAFNPEYTPQHPPLTNGQAWSYPLDNGITLRGEFFESAAGEQAPVLHFAHGNGLCCRVYEHFLAYAQQHFALFLHDSQGHGAADNGNEKTQGFSGWNATAERMVAVIRAQQQEGFLQGRRLIGSGHSFGGALTYLAAARQPHLFERLALFDAMIFPPGLATALAALSHLRLNHHHPLAKQARNRGAHWPSTEAAFSYFYKRGMLATWHDDCVYSYLQHSLEASPQGGVALRCPPWLEASIFANRPRGIWKAIPQISVPTTLFFGRDTYRFIRPAVARAKRLNPHINTHEIAGDHFFMLQNPNCLPADFWSTLAAS